MKTPKTYTVYVNEQWVSQLQGNKNDLNKEVKKVRALYQDGQVTWKEGSN